MAYAIRRALVRAAPVRPTACGQPIRAFAAPSKQTGEASMNELYMRALEPKPQPRVPMSPELRVKGEELAKTYTRLMWKRNRVTQKDFARKLKLKWAAIYALPTEELRKQALFFDPYVPLNYRMPTATPPLAGFSGAPEEAAKQAASASSSAAGQKSKQKRFGTRRAEKTRSADDEMFDELFAQAPAQAAPAAAAPAAVAKPAPAAAAKPPAAAAAKPAKKK